MYNILNERFNNVSVFYNSLIDSIDEAVNQEAHKYNINLNIPSKFKGEIYFMVKFNMHDFPKGVIISKNARGTYTLVIGQSMYHNSSYRFTIHDNISVMSSLEFNRKNPYTPDINTGSKMVIFSYALLYYIGVQSMNITDVATITCQNGQKMRITRTKLMSGQSGYYEKYGAKFVSLDLNLLKRYQNYTLMEVINESTEPKDAIAEDAVNQMYEVILDDDFDQTLYQLAKESSDQNCGKFDIIFAGLEEINNNIYTLSKMMEDQVKVFDEEDIFRLIKEFTL